MRNACIAALLALAGCTATGAWTRADTPRDQMVLDLQTCRGEARAQMASHQYYAREQAAADAAAAREVGRGDGTAAMNERWAEAGYRRDRDALIAGCMARKGYRRGTSAGGRPA
jgi:hypothetical protein